MLISCHFNPGCCQWNLIGCCLTPNVFDDKEMPNFLGGKISIAVGELTHSACFNPPIMHKNIKNIRFSSPGNSSWWFEVTLFNFHVRHSVPSIFVLVWYALIMLSSCFNSCEWTPTYLLIIFNNASFSVPDSWIIWIESINLSDYMKSHHNHCWFWHLGPAILHQHGTMCLPSGFIKHGWKIYKWGIFPGFSQPCLITPEGKHINIQVVPKKAARVVPKVGNPGTYNDW